MAESSPVEPIKVGPEPSRIVALHARDTAAAPRRAATHSGGIVASLRSRRTAQRGLVAALVALAISLCLLSSLASYRTKVFLSRTIFFFFFFELIKNNVFFLIRQMFVCATNRNFVSEEKVQFHGNTF